MNRLLIFIISLLMSTSAFGFSKAVIDSLKQEIAMADSPDDSLRLYLDLFDAADRALQQPVGNKALALAQRLNRKDLQLDLYRRLAVISNNDSALRHYSAMIDKLPYSPDKKLTQLYIDIRINNLAARNSTVEESRRRVSELMERARVTDGKAIDVRLQLLFALCAYIDQISTGELLTNHLEKIGELMDHMPRKLDALTTFYLGQSSASYTAMGDLKRAVASDKQLLEHLDSMQSQAQANGRRFRDFSYARYEIYRRLLGNYEELTLDETEEYYDAIKKVARQDVTAQYDLENNCRPTIYYLMKKKEYAKALPMIKKEITQTDHVLLPYVRRLLLNCMVEASEALGDRESLLDALYRLRKYEQSEEMRHTANQYRDLVAIYNQNVDKLRDTQVKLDQRNSLIASHRIMSVIVVIFLIVLVILITILLRVWLKGRRLNKNLNQVNSKLMEERDSLRRTQADLMRTGDRARQAEKQREQFINNMSHEVSTPLNAIVEYSQLIVDCSDVDKKPYLNKFANVIKLNTELVLTLVNDVLDLAAIDQQTMKVKNRPVVIGELAHVVCDTIQSHLQSSVKLVNNVKLDYNKLVNTDSKRVSQVLLNLLANAAKFTEHGTITLDGELSDDGTNYRFMVTDTGIGIPAGKEDIIFERFEKLNRYTQGIGLGLPVSRMVAHLLGGEVYVDRDYKGTSGTRFVFTFRAKDLKQ